MSEAKGAMVISQKNIENLIYTIRSQKVMLDVDLAEIYGYETKRLNEQVKRNISKFPNDFMFQLMEEEIEILRSQNATANISEKSRSNPYAFTEQGIYMLITVLKGNLAERQSIALVRAFKQMKDYLSDSQILLPSKELGHLAMITAQNTSDIAKIKSDMVTKTELDKFVKSFNDKRIAKDYVILDGHTVEADLAYSDIYSKAHKSVYVIDNYIGLKTLSLMKTVKPGVEVIIFSDNIKGMLSLNDYNDFRSQFGHPQINFYTTSGRFHDRYIILDFKTKHEKIYHCGASSKDAGKRITSITKVMDSINYHDMIDELLKNPVLVLK